MNTPTKLYACPKCGTTYADADCCGIWDCEQENQGPISTELIGEFTVEELKWLKSKQTKDDPKRPAYAVSQHDLICEATGTGKQSTDPGSTAYESICILLTKLDAAKFYLEKRKDEESKELLAYLNKHQDDEAFAMVPLY